MAAAALSRMNRRREIVGSVMVFSFQ